MTDAGPAAPGGTNVGNVSWYMERKIAEGVNATQALADFKADGGALRRQTWFRQYGEVAGRIAAGRTAGNLDPTALPGPQDYSTWSMGRGGQYAQQVYVDLRITGTSDIETRQYTVIRDEPFSAQDAIDEAMALYGDDSLGALYGSSAVGATAGVPVVTVPYSRAA